MWIDKDDVFADDKVWEFKISNPDAETHIRSTLTAKSPYPSALTRSQLLYQHALSHMSSDGNIDLAYKYPAGAIGDSPIPLSQELPVHSTIPVVDFATLQPLSSSAAPFVPRPVTASSSASDIATMFRQLRVHTPTPLTPDGQHAAQHLTASTPLNKPMKRLLFRSPLPKGEGIKQVLAWNREQLLDLRRLWELRRQQRITNGLIPMAQPPLMISDSALGVENKTSTATGTPQSSQTPHLISPLDSHCGAPFSLTAWRGLTSIVRKPQHWQLTLSMPSKTTKMPLRFRRPTTMAGSSRVSSPRALGSTKPSLPKGWVYVPEEVRTEVKVEVADPNLYRTVGVTVLMGMTLDSAVMTTRAEAEY
jgi:hypothetical protein